MRNKLVATIFVVQALAGATAFGEQLPTGVYHGRGTWSLLPEEAVTHSQGGLDQRKAHSRIAGPHSPVSLSEVRIYCNGRLPVTVLISVPAGHTALEYRLVLLHQTPSSRVFDLDVSRGADLVTFSAREISAGQYLVELHLAVGEYAFLSPGGGPAFTFGFLK